MATTVKDTNVNAAGNGHDGENGNDAIASRKCQQGFLERGGEPIVFSLRDVNLWFGTNHVLKNINLDIERNKVTAIIGPSGCGKSTLLRCLNLMNLVYDTCKIEGNITFEAKNILDSPGNGVFDIRKRVGMVFQKPNPFPKSIFQNIAYGPRIHKLDAKRSMDEIVTCALKNAALWDEVAGRLGESAMTLSGGQQQRLCIARALSVEPDVILMDEPCSALDPLATNKIEDLILELKRHYTVVIVTHNMQQAARVSDNTAFMYLGELIEVGATRTIFENPANKLTENYITGRFG